MKGLRSAGAVGLLDRVQRDHELSQWDVQRGRQRVGRRQPDAFVSVLHIDHRLPAHPCRLRKTVDAPAPITPQPRHRMPERDKIRRRRCGHHATPVQGTKVHSPLKFPIEMVHRPVHQGTNDNRPGRPRWRR